MNWAMIQFEGERIEIEWQCADAESRARAEQFAGEASHLELNVPGAMLAELSARLSGDRLILNALVLKE